MHSTLTCVLLAAAGAAGLLAAAPSSLHRPLRHGSLCMQEMPTPPPSDKLSEETLRKAVEAANGPTEGGGGGQWAPPPVQEEKEAFDPRIILYVSLPALVLGAQLFFTFSRDAFTGTENVGAANMDLNPPGFEKLR
eukprot:CAMPEP_0119058492 /NCGR_PEP_ID=MMETSP1178-20130426/2799_1 /TAXON_ID=33656 /ORGANISM="unid sp, Strain CCMP2000" /LENGTH=135 /DNA_ID=CAMNT_0007039429 /DNA_START=39 /DNA_END=446 /DNA_ORIENTATION=-